MSVKIKRSTGFFGIFMKVKIIVNGEKITSIHDGQKIVIDLPEEKVRLKVSQPGVKSNEIIVQDGNSVEITSTKSYQLIPLSMIALIIMNRFSFFEYGSLVYIILLLLILLFSFLVNGFYLKILENENKV